MLEKMEEEITQLNKMMEEPELFTCPNCLKDYTPELTGRDDPKWKTAKPYQREQWITHICSDKCWNEYLGIGKKEGVFGSDPYARDFNREIGSPDIEIMVHWKDGSNTKVTNVQLSQILSGPKSDNVESWEEVLEKKEESVCPKCGARGEHIYPSGDVEAGDLKCFICGYFWNPKEPNKGSYTEETSIKKEGDDQAIEQNTDEGITYYLPDEPMVEADRYRGGPEQAYYEKEENTKFEDADEGVLRKMAYDFASLVVTSLNRRKYTKPFTFMDSKPEDFEINVRDAIIEIIYKKLEGELGEIDIKNFDIVLDHKKVMMAISFDTNIGDIEIVCSSSNMDAWQIVNFLYKPNLHVELKQVEKDINDVMENIDMETQELTKLNPPTNSEPEQIPEVAPVK